MRAADLRRPLGRAELETLRQFLAATPRAMRLPQAHGFLTAIASAPTTLPPSAWQPRILGEPEFQSIEQARSVMGLVMRLYNHIVTELSEGSTLGPPNPEDDEAISLWCAGYLEATRMDEAWWNDEYGTALLFPFIVLAGEADLVGEEDDRGNIIEDPTPQLARCRETRAATVLKVNQYWTAWRRRNLAPVARQAPKIGRNEPCPCGSGRKFKKCCALKVN